MNVQVEIFKKESYETVPGLEEEVNPRIIALKAEEESLTERLKLVQSFTPRLRGQEIIIEKRLADITKELRIEENPERAWPKIEEQMAKMINIAFPRKRPIEEFSLGIIPREILEEVKKTQSCFSEIEVATAERVKDSVVIGRIENRHFLIARWGEVLTPFSRIQRFQKIGKVVKWIFLFSPIIVGGVTASLISSDVKLLLLVLLVLVLWVMVTASLTRENIFPFHRKLWWNANRLERLER